ncbi:MAG TPA: hypothetical protein VK009_00885 [Chloroflexota bacterium]|nr:hypothetical protein [Chloroflexota bacterium]
MPDDTGAARSGEEAAQKLLSGSDPASLSSSDLLAAIDALAAMKTPEAANALARLDQPKEVAKAARRALFRLQTAGIRPSEEPAKAQPEAEAPRAPAATIKLQEARISSYDPRGTRAISILAEKPFTGLINMFAIASDVDGLLDAELSTTTKKAYFARLENFTRQYGYIEFVPTPPDYANQVIHQCAELNEKSGTPLPQDFSMWKSFGAEPPQSPLDPPILSELSPDDVKQRVKLEDTKDLAHTEFEAWVYEEEQLKEHATRLDTARGGPLVISKDAQKGREKGIVDDATDAIFKDEELARAKQRLQETAHFLLQKGQKDEAEKCLRAALEVDAAAPHDQPFLREIVSKSFDLLDHEGHDHEHGHEHEAGERPTTRTESGIVLPA